MGEPSWLARCSMPGCPVRWTTPGSTDHPCAEHQHGGGDIAAAAKALGIELAPGDRDDDGDSA